MALKVALLEIIDVIAAQPVSLPESVLSVVAVGISTDSRDVKSGQIFLALRGETFDGHQFVETAIGRGAIAAITDHLVQGSDGSVLPQLVVEDTLKAYQMIARWWRDRLNIPVIAVTGSVGKTTTKELIAAVLATQGRVLKTQANFNNEIGVPKTLMELDESHDYAVVEMGMRGAGEIALLTQIAHPHIAVITNVGTAHIGRLGSEQAIADAKCELLANLRPEGVAVLNHDNLRLMNTAAQVWQGKTITYGLEGGDLHGHIVDHTTLEVQGWQLPLPLPGQHNALNYLAALAVATILKIDWTPLQHGLDLALPQGRAQRIDLPHDVVILDETYNAGLESMLAALKLLVQTPGKRYIAILGTMKELGERSPEFHYQVGQAVKLLNIDRLLILADEAEGQAMAAGADPVSVEQYFSHEAVVDRLKDLVQSGDRLLFKASRAVGLDQVVTQLRQYLIVS
jgi:UDP-N-acetylmuramoyl-tripeptide--D-alanyl-D-alanine ligase